MPLNKRKVLSMCFVATYFQNKWKNYDERYKIYLLQIQTQKRFDCLGNVNLILILTFCGSTDLDDNQFVLKFLAWDLEWCPLNFFYNNLEVEQPSKARA